MEIFTPKALPHAPNLRWWLSEEYTQPEFNGAELIQCPHCGEFQKLEWFWAFTTSLIDCELIEERCKLYAAIERAENQLVDLHECKVALARLLLEQCLMVHRGKSSEMKSHCNLCDFRSLPAHVSLLVAHFSHYSTFHFIVFILVIRITYH